MKNKTILTPVLVERLFLSAIFILIALLVVNFIFVTRLLETQTKQVDRTRIDAEVSGNDIKTIQSATEKIQKDSDAFKRAESVVAQSKLYQYQDQIINDLQDYAKQNGLKISGYSFTANADSSSSKASPPPTTDGTSTPSTSTPSGVSSTTVDVTINQSVPYKQFLGFLKSIENNVTRMQVATISLTPDVKNPKLISSPSLSIMVFTR